MKTWIQLLGNDPSNCVVHGKYISRHLGNGHYKVMHHCEDNAMAIAVMQAWLAEFQLYQR